VKDLIRKRNLVPENPLLHIENWPWLIRIYTLGRFELLKDDKPVQVTGKVQKKPLELLKVLVALGGKDVAESQLIDALWPDADGDIAVVSFRTTLHRLRKLMGNDDAVQLRGGQVSVNAGYCWVDTWAFERMFDEALRKEEAPSPGPLPAGERSISAIEKALALYKGQFLPADAREPWGMSMREHLRSRFLQLTLALGRHWEGTKQHEKAAECYQQGLKTDSLAEEFYQNLMVCHSKRGQQAEAVKVYHRCRAMLVKSLGLAPSTKTEEIYASLLNK
jgi:two-component SAPR family response regulator